MIPGRYKEPRRGVRTTVFGQKREWKLPTDKISSLLMTIIASLDPNSEGRLERIQRLEREAGLNRSKIEQGGLIAA